MAASMRVGFLGCVFQICLISANALTVRRVPVPHNTGPGFVVASMPYWGQSFSIDKSWNRYFTVLHNGDLVTAYDISSLLGSKISLVVFSELGSEQWQDTVHIDVQDGDKMVIFPLQEYHGHVGENKPPGTMVMGLSDLQARLGSSGKTVHYTLSAGPPELFDLKEYLIDGISHVQILTKAVLDREQKHNYKLVVKAATDDPQDKPSFAKIKVKITDENDNVPQFEQTRYHTTISDTTPAMTTVFSVRAVDPDHGKIRYFMDSHPLFRIDPDEGHIILGSRAELEPQSYQLKIRAKDSGGLESKPVTVVIEVEGGSLHYGSHDNTLHKTRHKRAIRVPKKFDVPESVTGELIRLSTDSYERFAFKEPAPEQLEINTVTGAIRLKSGMKLDYEEQKEISFVVLIRRVNEPEVQDEQPVTITLTDTNDEMPRFVNKPRPFLATVSANAAPGTSVYQLYAVDDDQSSQIKYILESGGMDRFELDDKTGIVRTKGNQPFQHGKEYEIGVSAEDSKAKTKQKSATHSLKILVGERDPQFFDTQYVASVPETADTQYEITFVQAHSHQEYPITYELKTDSNHDSNEFAINAKTGKVDLLRHLDYEKDPQQYHLRIKAIENGRPQRESSVNLIINLIDMNDNSPMFPLSQYIVQGIAETVLNGTPIMQVTATDQDSVTNSQLTYSVNDGNFTVESLNNIGYIKTARTLDYDYIPDHTYNFTVIATDNGSPARNGSAMVRVTVTNVNDEDPVFSQSIEHVQVSEDASLNTVVHVVQAYDPDGDDVSYSFTGDRLTEGPFRIDPNSGILTLVGQLDKTQVAYKLNITATDNGRCCGSKVSRSSRGLVIVEVKDINNNAPRFPHCGSYLPSVLERENVGTSVIQVKAEDSDTGDNGNVTYSLVKSIDQDSERFAVDAVTGVTRTAEVFDRESKSGVKDFGVTVKAEDQGSPRLAGFCTFRVRIGDKNDNPPVFDSPSYEITIEESSPIGSRVRRVYATDKDAGENARVEYYLKSDPSGFFDINQHTGWITVKNPMIGRDHVILEIEARDNGTPQKSSTVTMTIKITQTVNQYPQWVQDYSAAAILLSENVPINYVVKRLKAISSVPDSTVNYVIQPGDTPEQNGNPRSFYRTINETTNEMMLRVYRALDYETTAVYTMTIMAANRATNSLHNDTRIRIELIDKNDEIPQFVGLDENGRYPGSVAENMAAGAEVITVTAKDRDEFPAYKKIRYSIKNIGPDATKFTIKSDTGVVTTRETFDREEKDEYYITVVAQDGAKSDRPNHYPPGTPNQGEAEVQIRITDKNDNAPYFAHRLYNASIPENIDMGSTVIMVTAEDEDEENRLTYSIIGGNIGNVFEVRSDLGQIKVRGNLDYEDGPREYKLTYRVFDDKYANTATVMVKIRDVNDNPPRFDPSEYVVSDIVEEDRTITARNPKYLLTVHAYDPDIDRHSDIVYALTGQFAHDGTFMIKQNTGEVFLTKPLDRDDRPIWSFNVLAYDEPRSGNSLTGYAVVQVEPKDINDNAPVFDPNRLKGRVEEHSRAGQSVMTVVATDKDKGNNKTVMYSLRQAPAKGSTPLFAINPTTGLITTTLNNALDREVQDKYEIIVQASDNGTPDRKSSTAMVTIFVEDVNDHSPKFTEKCYRTTMSENYPAEASIISVSATDRDVGTYARLTYMLPDEEDRKYFSITNVEATNTGVLRVFKPVDFDTLDKPSFNVTVQVNDPDPMHIDTACIEVHVLDYNDNPPVFVPNSQKVSVFENVTIGTTLARFSATDKDTGRNQEFYYTIDRNTDPDRQFNIDAQPPGQNGYVITAKKLDREKTPVHRVHILAIDKGAPPQTGTGTLIVSLMDVNDNYPIFAEDYRPVVYEGEKAGTTVVTVSAKDLDTATNGPPFEFWLPCRGGCPCTANPTCVDFSFSFVPETGGNAFGAGTVKTRRTFDREKTKYYYMPIVMKDSGIPYLSGTNTLTITIGDRNDNKHSPGHKNIFVYNYKGMFRNAALGNVYAEDPDDWDVVDKDFHFVDPKNSPARYFVLDESSGLLSMKEGVREGVYNFEVRVNDRVWKRGVVSTVSVNVKEISDDAIFNSGSVRLRGITAEEFVARPKSGPGTRDYGLSKYDLFRAKMASHLAVPVTNVDIFTVMNHPTLPRTCDVRFAAHGSPYYRPVRLDGIVSEAMDEFAKELGVEIAMVPIDECVKERCDSGGCSNRLITTSEPMLINTNGTSLVGITAYVEAECVCAARNFSGSDVTCRPDSCHNGGTCVQREYDYVCECYPGFDGPKCQETHHSFEGEGWAWYKPLAQCEGSHTSLEFITRQDDGLIFYDGPMHNLDPRDPDATRDFISLELRNGYPVLQVDHGSGMTRLEIDGRDRQNRIRLNKLHDGNWHRVDIYREGQRVRMVVDHCRDAVVSENEMDQTSEEDRRPCEAERETPGENKYLNVPQPLQLGGRANPDVAYPEGVTKKNFNGCIKNFNHNGELYDLHIGNVGEHMHSEDGCPRQDYVCQTNEVEGPLCGINGTCVANFQGSYKCYCKPGYRGTLCNIPTSVKDFLQESFIEWDYREQFYQRLLHNLRYQTHLQLQFRTRRESGLLFKVQNIQKSEYLILELKDRILTFRFNLGSGEESVSLSHANVTDGQWHTVFVERYGHTATMKLDGGEGRFYNETIGHFAGHLEIKVAQRQFFAGGDVKYPSIGSKPIVDYDFHDSCMSDIRYENEWLPMSAGENGHSLAADVKRVENLNDTCSSFACKGISCTLPLQCANLWRYYECRCPKGQKLVSSKEVCKNVNECFGHPCYHGVCVDTPTSFTCQCDHGWSGRLCGERQEAMKLASMSEGAILAMIICFIVVLLLVVLFIIYTRRRRPEALVVTMDPDDDIRENIINYDEEGVGEEDQDAYDINRLKKPLDNSLPDTMTKPPMEKIPVEKQRPIRRAPPTGEQPDVGDFINNRLKDADDDPNAPPHDTVREFAYEGGGSDAGSLSSLASTESGDQNYDYLGDWGTRFAKLADMYGGQE